VSGGFDEKATATQTVLYFIDGNKQSPGSATGWMRAAISGASRGRATRAITLFRLATATLLPQRPDIGAHTNDGHRGCTAPRHWHEILFTRGV
jgi:hypothetical protein